MEFDSVFIDKFFNEKCFFSSRGNTNRCSYPFVSCLPHQAGQTVGFDNQETSLLQSAT
ncbi:hypothetical protein Lfee_0389 [Legionella feeleii]|uniref:Uncharacterized protein n=1 Tax=Legionella feeleii TaxID=453 RepID=A0A0W0U7D6_9GAMM|nr:hypothetical protein Lfee_0389 [Legionella feeleii]SPX59221.1 Uncharacterised protein [Legionella feeleii]